MVLPKIRKISEPVAIKVENFNECHPMSYTLQSWQIGKIDTPRKEAMLTFLVSLMNQPVFDYLRKGIFIKIFFSLTPRLSGGTRESQRLLNRCLG